MRVFVLGNKGMLGRYVFDYLNLNGFDVIGFSRKDFDASIVLESDLLKLGFDKDDVIINCIGMIKRNDVSKFNYVLVNSVFPHLLNNVCKITGSKMIHVTTDCVYDGLEGGYNESHVPTANDIYGMSKFLGEPEDATVIRTSIIGEEVNNNRSLLEWVRGNKGNTINGYTNHFWNGITCLKFAEVCEYMINDNIFWRGVKHIFSPTVVNKLELVTMISDVYELDIKVTPFETTSKCDRSLSSNRTPIVFCISDIKTQLYNMKNFSLSK